MVCWRPGHNIITANLSHRSKEMNSCHGEAVEDACTSGDVSLPRHGSEVVFTSWESEGLEAAIVFYILSIVMLLVED